MASLDSVGGQVQSSTAVVADKHLQVKKSSSEASDTGQRRQDVVASGQNSPSVAEPRAGSDPAQISAADLESVAAAISDYSQNISRELRFTIDESENRVVITVMNDETNEIIRQIPPEEVRNLAQKMKENSGSLEKGMLLNMIS